MFVRVSPRNQTMEQIRQRAHELLEAGAVQVIIGYEKRSNGRLRPLFARRPEQLDQLTFEDNPPLNLAVYLRKPEVKQLGKSAVVATPAVLRSILHLAAENQYRDSEALLLALGPQGAVLEMSTAAEIENFLGSVVEPRETPSCADIEALDRDARFAFWQREFERCIRCYACRASCPMCYCDQCISDCNQPQWVPVPAHSVGNLEWHVSRAMHLAGRCVGCGACTEACPAGIPLRLLNQFLAGLVAKEFDQRADARARLDYPLSVFCATDQEDFIK
jgi:ferredoxin